MARKKGNKKALTSSERVNLHRKRKKLERDQIKRVQEQLELMERTDLDVATISPSEIENKNKPQIKNQLRSWANEHRISKRALNDLLKILTSNGMPLPKNYRTLQETPVNIEIIQAAGGQLWFNGLKKCLKHIFSTLTRDITIYLNFNIDGLPIYKSSKLCFWPVLFSIAGMHCIIHIILFIHSIFRNDLYVVV